MIKMFNILSEFVSKYITLEKTFNHYKIIKNIKTNINHQKLLFYTDKFKTSNGSKTATILMSNENIYNWTKH